MRLPDVPDRVPGRFVAPPEPARKDPKQKEGTGRLGSYAAAFGDFAGALPMAETSGAAAAGANQMQIWLGDFMASDAVADAEFTGVDTTCG